MAKKKQGSSFSLYLWDDARKLVMDIAEKEDKSVSDVINGVLIKALIPSSDSNKTSPNEKPIARRYDIMKALGCQSKDGKYAHKNIDYPLNFQNTPEKEILPVIFEHAKGIGFRKGVEEVKCFVEYLLDE